MQTIIDLDCIINKKTNKSHIQEIKQKIVAERPLKQRLVKTSSNVPGTIVHK